MTNPSVLMLRITAIILVLVAMGGIALYIKRQRDRERDRHDGHPRYRGSSLDGGHIPDNGITDFEAGGVEMHKTSRLNPGFFGGKSAAPAKPRGTPPELLLPLTIMAPQGRPFSGKNVARLVQNFGLQYSPNRTYELLTAGGEDVFCTLLNVRRPPTFPENLDTPEANYEGLLIVLQLPVGQEPVQDCAKVWKPTNSTTTSGCAVRAEPASQLPALRGRRRFQEPPSAEPPTRRPP